MIDLDPLFERFLAVRTEEHVALGKPLLEAGIMPLAIMAPGKGHGWFISATAPASAGLFGGIPHSEFGSTPEECVEKILAWYADYWGGL